MNRLPRTVRHVLLVPTVLAAVLGLPGPAHAGTWEYDVAVKHNVGTIPEVIPCDYTASTPIGGYGCYERNGDIFHVWDTHKDGESVGIQWKLEGGSRAGICRNKLGASSEPGDCNKDLPESRTFYMRYGLCDGDTSACTQPIQYHYWGSWVKGTA